MYVCMYVWAGVCRDAATDAPRGGDMRRYNQLCDKEASVRKNALMVLTHLILNDMIKVTPGCFNDPTNSKKKEKKEKKKERQTEREREREREREKEKLTAQMKHTNSVFVHDV